MWCNTQVTYSPSPNNARSESELEFNPLNALNVVGASKRFNNPATYDFTLAAYFSFDGGQGWAEAPPFALLSDPDPNKIWSGVSDPTIAWDASAHCRFRHRQVHLRPSASPFTVPLTAARIGAGRISFTPRPEMINSGSRAIKIQGARISATCTVPGITAHNLLLRAPSTRE
jgi:hypothetical protein